jgi:hypothetical protein
MRRLGKPILLTSLLLLIALQQALALGSASMQMARAQQYTTDDITLICSGQTMKWVSVSQSELLGEFVYIDPNELNISVPSMIDCTNSVLGDTVSDEWIELPLFETTFDAFSALTIKGYQSPLSAITFLAHWVRGPPLFL